MATGADQALSRKRRDPVALVAAIRAGEAAAEHELVQEYGRAIAIILHRHTNGRPEAEDLFQDTFCTALRKLRDGELREPARLPEYLSQIARYLALEHYRKAARRRTEADSELLERVETASQSPLAKMLAQERAALARRLIGELGRPRDREVLYRFYIAEEDRDRIAADLGLSAGQLSRVLHRARQRFRVLFLDHLHQSDATDGDRARRQSPGAAMTALVITLLRMSGI